jgi:hypothetical protein
MEKYMFSIYDKTAELYEAPYIDTNTGTAIRRIQDLIQSNPNAPYSKFPECYSLYEIGSWDETIGHASTLPNIKHVIDFIQLTSPITEGKK